MKAGASEKVTQSVGVRSTDPRRRCTKSAKRTQQRHGGNVDAAIYARKSTDQTGVADAQKSVARQIDHARTYAASKGWTSRSSTSM